MNVNLNLDQESGVVQVQNSPGLMSTMKSSANRMLSTVDESFRIVETVATDIRLVAELAKIQLVTAKGEASIDAVKGFMSRGLSPENAQSYFNQLMND